MTEVCPQVLVVELVNLFCVFPDPAEHEIVPSDRVNTRNFGEIV
jgi:hypothetical protein